MASNSLNRLVSSIRNVALRSDLAGLWWSAGEEFKETLARALEHGEVSMDDGYRLIRTNSQELPALLATANILRLKHKGRRINFSRKVFIPLTNLCRNTCGYCGFRRHPWEKDAGFLNPSDVVEIAKKGMEAGCNEALFTLGEKPEEKHREAREQLKKLGYSGTVEYLRDMCEKVIVEMGLLPHSNPGILSKEEVSMLREVNVSMGLMLENVSSRLGGKGMPHEFSPGKDPASRLATLEYAGQLKVAFTTGLLIGIGETLEEMVDSMFAIKRLHERYGHIQEIIIQPFKPKKETPMQSHPEPSETDLLRTVATARLIFGGGMNIQVPPNLTRDLWQAVLLSGINDWGGVSPITVDHVNPEEPWPKIHELEKFTVDCEFELKERLAIYPEYIVEKPSFIPERLREAVLERADEEGYVKRKNLI